MLIFLHSARPLDGRTTRRMRWREGPPAYIAMSLAYMLAPPSLLCTECTRVEKRSALSDCRRPAWRWFSASRAVSAAASGCASAPLHTCGTGTQAGPLATGKLSDGLGDWRGAGKVASPSSFSASFSRSTSLSTFAGVVGSPGSQGWPPQERRPQLLGKGPLSVTLVVRHEGGTSWLVSFSQRIASASEQRVESQLMSVTAWNWRWKRCRTLRLLVKCLKEIVRILSRIRLICE